MKISEFVSKNGSLIVNLSDLNDYLDAILKSFTYGYNNGSFISNGLEPAIIIANTKRAIF